MKNCDELQKDLDIQTENVKAMITECTKLRSALQAILTTSFHEKDSKLRLCEKIAREALFESYHVGGVAVFHSYQEACDFCNINNRSREEILYEPTNGTYFLLPF